MYESHTASCSSQATGFRRCYCCVVLSLTFVVATFLLFLPFIYIYFLSLHFLLCFGFDFPFYLYVVVVVAFAQFSAFQYRNRKERLCALFRKQNL